MSGFFVTFEGVEGIGKSTQVKLLSERLSSEGYKVRCLREPGGTPIGEEVRHLLKHGDASVNMFSETELLLFNSSRAQLVREVINPALEKGEIVLCDRFYDSTLAYQGYGRGLDLTKLRQIINFAVGDLRPDLTFFIDLTPERGFENRRLQSGVKTKDRFEDDLNLDFFNRVYGGFLDLVKAEPERFRVVPYMHQNIKGMTDFIYEEMRTKWK